MLITKKMHEARVKAIREAVKDESKDYYIFRREESWGDGCMQSCVSYITDNLEEVKNYVKYLPDTKKKFTLLIDFDEFEKGDGKKVRGFAPVYTAEATEVETKLPVYCAGYIRKIEKDRK